MLVFSYFARYSCFMDICTKIAGLMSRMLKVIKVQRDYKMKSLTTVDVSLFVIFNF